MEVDYFNKKCNKAITDVFWHPIDMQVKPSQQAYLQAAIWWKTAALSSDGYIRNSLIN